MGRAAEASPCSTALRQGFLARLSSTSYLAKEGGSRGCQPHIHGMCITNRKSEVGRGGAGGGRLAGVAVFPSLACGTISCCRTPNQSSDFSTKHQPRTVPRYVKRSMSLSLSSLVQGCGGLRFTDSHNPWNRSPTASDFRSSTGRRSSPILQLLVDSCGGKIARRKLFRESPLRRR